MKIVEYLESDYGSMKKLWLESFKEDSIAFFDEYMATTHKKGKTYFLKDGKEILSMLTYINKEIVLNKVKYHSVLIEGVATPQEHMRKGYMNKLMEYVIMKEKALKELIIIQAYNTEVYKKYGFVETHNLKHGVVSLVKEHEYKDDSKVDAVSLHKIYKKYVNDKDGYHDRSTDDFNDLIRQVQSMKGDIHWNSDAYVIFFDGMIQEIAYNDKKSLSKLLKGLEGEFKIQLAEDETFFDEIIKDVSIKNNTMLLTFSDKVVINKKLYFPEFV